MNGGSHIHACMHCPCRMYPPSPWGICKLDQTRREHSPFSRILEHSRVHACRQKRRNPLHLSCETPQGPSAVLHHKVPIAVTAKTLGIAERLKQVHGIDAALVRGNLGGIIASQDILRRGCPSRKKRLCKPTVRIGERGFILSSRTKHPVAVIGSVSDAAHAGEKFKTGDSRTRRKDPMEQKVSIARQRFSVRPCGVDKV